MIRIGTSNWSQQEIRATLPRARLPPGGMLQAYARVFDTVEINSTFYRFHQAKTFAGWRQWVPEGFVFSIKANRLFTHELALQDPGEELDDFLGDIRQLGPALGPVLFQIPSGLHADLPLLKRFVTTLKKRGEGLRFTFELRHPSWHAPATWKLLEKAGVGFCLFDIREYQPPPAITSDLVYVRLHGPLKTPYQGRYGAEALRPWAERLAGWSEQGLDCFTYFDNTQFGDAVPDALTLRELLRAGTRAA